MRIAVVGDVLLDVDMTGAAHRLSPDAPVPVIEVEESLPRAGGAGLVATMLARDGHDVRLVTVLSDDRHSATLRECLQRIEVVAGPSGTPTPVKTRVRADGHAIARIDEGCAPPPTPPRPTRCSTRSPRPTPSWSPTTAAASRAIRASAPPSTRAPPWCRSCGIRTRGRAARPEHGARHPEPRRGTRVLRRRRA